LADAKRTLPGVRIRRLARREAHPLLPGKAFDRETVRAEHIGEGTRILGNVRQVKPRLHRRVEGVGMEECLRIARTRAGMSKNALGKYPGFRIAAPDVADQATPRR